MTEVEPQLLGEALVVWTGMGRLWREEHLVEKYGSIAAAELLPKLKRLERDFYESDARDKPGDLAEMGDLAAEHLQQLHPEIPLEGVSALRWCYTFDFR